MRTLLLLCTGILALVSLLSAEPPINGRPITIKAVEGLQFDRVQAKMNPGQTLIIRFINQDPNDQPHNIVFLKPGTLAAVQAASMQIDENSEKRGYVPEHDAILAASSLLKADESEEFRFTAPEEPGVYPYVCTYPGHSMIMYGALYVGTRYGSIEKDPNVPQVARDAALADKAQKVVKRPSYRRFFIDGVGPASIAVALEHDMNYCWDAGNCRLRSAWSGTYIKLGDTSRSNGSRPAYIGMPPFWDGAGGKTTYTIASAPAGTQPSFNGYRLIDGKPEFRYAMGELQVTEYITSTPTGLSVQLKITGATAPVKLYLPGKVTASAGERSGDYLTVSPADAQHLTLTIAQQ